MGTDGSSTASSNGAWTVRPAVAGDGSQMRQLAHAAYQHYVPRIGRDPAPMTADYASIASSGQAWVAEQCGRLIGLVLLEPHLDHLLLENLAVHPDQQGAGVGHRLMTLAEEQAQLMGLPEVRLFTNAAMTENLDYYARRGYRQTHHAEQDGYQRVFFSKPLHNAEQ